MQNERWLNLLKKYWMSLLAALIFTLIFIIANATPNIQFYALQVSLERLMTGILGGIYRIAKSLSYIGGAIFIGVFVFSIITIVMRLVLQRRFPTLLPIILIYAANCILFGAPGLIFAPNLSASITDCDLYITGEMGIRVVRYPLDAQMEYAEQQFFLITHNTGQDWRQFQETFVYNPVMTACDTIRFADDLNGSIEFERSSSKNRTQLVRYVTLDGGETWTEEE